MAAAAPLGIDLGTTNSLLAVVDARGEPVVLRNGLDEEKTASAVWFESPGSVLVGSAALRSALLGPERLVTLIKRQMGSDRLLSFFGQEYTPESISALILRAVVDGHVGSSGGVPAVITVPAYFGVREREATKQAALLAGLEVLELLSEPVAAALHYRHGAPPRAGTTLVYDLGGGTFDATLLRGGDDVVVVATDGDVELGGADWDARLVSHLLDRSGLHDAADDPDFMAQLAATAERTKQDLSARTSCRVPIRYAGAAVTVPIDRAEFESMTRDLVDTTLACVERLLGYGRQAGVTNVDTVLLVGGSSRMPMIRDRLAAAYGWAPRLYDPDTAVAKGAALRAAALATAPPASGRQGGAITARQTASVVPRSIGVLIEDSTDPAAERVFVQHAIHRNEPLPVTDRTVTVSTIVPRQDGVRIQVYEQAGAVESPEVGHNRLVMDGELRGLPADLRAGAPIRLMLSVDLDGRLRLSATEPGSGAQLVLEAFVEGVIDGQQRQRAAAGLRALTVRQ